MHTLQRTFAAAVAVFSATVASAQPKAADFNGQWELNVAKSDFGPMAQQAPTKASMTVTQSPASIKLVQAVTTAAGDQNQTQELALDGQDHTAPGMDGQPATSSAKLDGDAVVVNTKMTREGTDITMVSRWTLSPDGKTLTVARDIVTPMGPLAMKLVYDKK
jgi:hypothetical protein